MKPRVHLRDIADAIGISASSVSLALRDDPRISEKTRRRVRDTADELGYAGASRRSASDPLWRFGFVYCDPAATTFDPVLFQPVQKLLMRDALPLRARFEMLLADGQMSDVRARQTLVEFVSHLQGVLLFGRVHAPVLELLHRLGIPAVVIGETDITYAQAAALKVQRVTDDPMRAGMLATQYLLNRGRRRIAFISGIYERGLFYDQWYRGYLLAHAQAGEAIVPQRVLWHQPHVSLHDRVRQLAKKHKPDGIVWPDASVTDALSGDLRDAQLRLAPADQVVAGMSHVDLPPRTRDMPQILSDLAAMTKEAIRRLKIVCKSGADTAATITIAHVARNFPEESEVKL